MTSWTTEITRTLMTITIKTTHTLTIITMIPATVDTLMNEKGTLASTSRNSTKEGAHPNEAEVEPKHAAVCLLTRRLMTCTMVTAEVSRQSTTHKMTSMGTTTIT